MTEAMRALMTVLEKQEAQLEEWGTKGAVMIATKTGPVGIAIIRALVAVAEDQANQIAELQKKLDAMKE